MEFDYTSYMPKIYVNNTIENHVDAALQFYKSPKLNIKKGVVIELLNAPVIDVGGIERDFFSRVYQKLSSGHLNFFEGNSSHVRPVCSMSSLSSGILKAIGTMIHNEQHRLSFITCDVLLHVWRLKYSHYKLAIG